MKKIDLYKLQVEPTINELQNIVKKMRYMKKIFQEQQEALYVIAEFANDWEYWQDENGTYQYVSPSCQGITGYTPDNFYKDSNLLQKIIVKNDWQKWKDHNHTLAEGDKVKPIEFEIRTKNGETKWIHHICRSVINGNGKKIGIRGSNRDISELKALQNEIKHAAGHDRLTGLANRSLLMEHLKQTMKQAERDQSMFVVVFIDIDNFKKINDQYGHSAGDHVLQRVSHDLLKTMRSDDIVARFGGDEFVGLFKIKSQNDSVPIKKKILNKINMEIQCQRFKITIRLSVGISIYPTDGKTSDILLKKADTEMYIMKAKNKAKFK